MLFPSCSAAPSSLRSRALNRRVLLSASGCTLLLQACGAKTDDSAQGGGAAAPQASAAPQSVLSVAEGSTPFQELERRRGELGGFAVGNLMARTRAIVVYDPLCPHCARLWRTSEPLRNRASFYWVPVGFLGAASRYLGALTLQAQAPIEEMNAIEAAIQQNGQSPEAVLQERGVTAGADGQVQYPPALQAALDKVAANTQYASDKEIDGVPFVVYANDTSTVLRSFSGARETQQLIELFDQAG